MRMTPQQGARFLRTMRLRSAVHLARRRLESAPVYCTPARYRRWVRLGRLLRLANAALELERERLPRAWRSKPALGGLLMSAGFELH